MAARKGGLGRGLDSLLPVDRPKSGFGNISLDSVEPNPQQPRLRFDAESLQSLAASIGEVGVLQPVVVRPDGEGYLLIAGERRCRAARMAGLETIPAIIKEDEIDGLTSLADALIENVQREDLSPLEEAAGYEQLMEEFGMTHEAVAERVGKSRSAITNTLRLLQLPTAIQGMVSRGEIAAGHARALLALDDQAYAVHLAQRIADEGWSVRQVEDAVKKRAGEKNAQPAGQAVRPAAIIELEDRLGEHLGTAVKIDHGKRGGKLVIRYASLDDLERIYGILS
ncbi:MAG: ParB/RepB/Spo0J family partition protein [bacterium]|nr:ParB/RepB/Spo0J family partition protein [bacterium]